MTESETAFLASLERWSPSDRSRVQVALDFAKRSHEGQQRASGIPYIVHPIAVAQYLVDLDADAETVMAALLHDIMEDQGATFEEIEKACGTTVAVLVDGVTKLSKLRYEGRREARQLASLRKLLLTANDDLRVIFIKLADRWHNILTIDALAEDKRKRITMETLDIYVPFARLVGLWELKSFFEEVCFPLALPEEYAVWHKAIAEARKNLLEKRQEFVARVNAETRFHVEASLDLMTDYHVYQKFGGVINRLEESYSLDTAQLLLVGKDLRDIDCYRVLGEVHSRYPVVFGSFRDYISIPKPNGYQALHTAISLSASNQVRVRIQTIPMREHVVRRKLSTWIGDQENDVYDLLDAMSEASEDVTFRRDLNNTLLAERITVFTGEGEQVHLPEGATGVDFVYAVSPDVIESLTGVRVNGELRESIVTLKSGDRVEPELLKGGTPRNLRRVWMDRSKSAGVRRLLHDNLQHQSLPVRAQVGWQLLEEEFNKLLLPVSWLRRRKPLQEKLAREMRRESFQQLLDDISTGVVSVRRAAELYQRIIDTSPSLFMRLLKFFKMLPKSQRLSRDAQVLDIEVHALNRKKMIYDITRCFAERDINIVSFAVFAVPPNAALYRIRIEIENMQQLDDLFDTLRQIPMVTKVLRLS